MMHQTPLTRRQSGMNSQHISPIFEVGGAVAGVVVAHYLDHMYRMGDDVEDIGDVPEPSVSGALNASFDHQVVMMVGAVAGYKAGVLVA